MKTIEELIEEIHSEVLSDLVKRDEQDKPQVRGDMSINEAGAGVDKITAILCKYIMDDMKYRGVVKATGYIERNLSGKLANAALMDMDDPDEKEAVINNLVTVIGMMTLGRYAVAEMVQGGFGDMTDDEIMENKIKNKRKKWDE